MSDMAKSVELAAERASRLAKIKAAYQKIYNNPFRTNHSIFDPAAFRYESARAYAKDYYKYTPRSMLFPLAAFAAIVVVQRYVNIERAEKERVIRAGEATYYERAKYASRGLY